MKNSERVTINNDNEVIYVDKVPTGLKAAVFLYSIQQRTKNLHNPAFIIILFALKLNEKLVINQNANHAVHSPSFNLQEKRETGPSRTRPTSPLGSKEVVQTLEEVKKQKRKKF